MFGTYAYTGTLKWHQTLRTNVRNVKAIKMDNSLYRHRKRRRDKSTMIMMTIMLLIIVTRGNDDYDGDDGDHWTWREITTHSATS